MTPSSRFLTFAAVLLFPLVSLGQQSVTDTLHLVSNRSQYQLSNRFVFDSTESVLLPPRILVRGVEYVVNYRSGSMVFSDSILRRLGTDTVSALVSYKTIPMQFKDEYSLHQLRIVKDSTGEERRAFVPEPSPFLMSDLFGDNLRKSGSLVRGFTVGTNRDLSLNSGLRMQLAGKLADNIDVVAALTDENSPIQPEGTTQTLQEVDKVFVDLNSPFVGATLGDFNVEADRNVGGEFGRLQRKVQGAQGRVRSWKDEASPDKVSASVTGAVGRGKFHTLQFTGQEGNQGPYRLTGKNGERQIIVIAGSERVYLDGIRMTRGETNDYTIDYAGSEITFSSRRLITSASRIVVDFEYSDRQYTRNLLNAQVSASFAGNRARIHSVFTQESDDISSPIDFTLDDSTRAILQQSGGDPLKASRYGASFVGSDSLGIGRGQYAVRDTIIGSVLRSYFLYRPGDSSAVYNVIFSRVDRVPPDSLGYSRIALGQFQVAGIGQGNYLPVQLLPIPTLVRTVDVNADVDIFRDLSVGGEFALSQNDRNRLSSLDDANRNGQAYKFKIEYRPREMEVGSLSLGNADVLYSERFVASRFVSPDRSNEVEFNRKWNFDELASGDETIRELSVGYQPMPSLDFNAGAGSMTRRGIFRSNRTHADIAFRDSVLPQTRYSIEDIRSNTTSTQERSTWIRQRGTSEVQLGPLKPAIRIEAEDRKLLPSPTDSLAEGSFRYLELAPHVETKEIAHMRGSAEFQMRSQDSAVAGNMRASFKAYTQLYTWELRDWKDISSSLTLSVRRTEFSRLAKSRGNGNADVILVRSTTRYAPLRRAAQADFYYEFSNQRSARLERVFVRVPQGHVKS